MSTFEHAEPSENERGRDNLAPEQTTAIDPLDRLIELSKEIETVWAEAARNGRRRGIFRGRFMRK